MSNPATADLRPRHRRRRHQRRRHRARRRRTWLERRPARAGRPRGAYVIVEHQADPRRAALPRVLRVPAGGRGAGRARSAARARRRTSSSRCTSCCRTSRTCGPAWMIRAGLFLYDHLGGRRTLPSSFGVDLRRDTWGAGLKPRFHKGFVYSDARVDDARLVVAQRDRRARARRGHPTPHRMRRRRGATRGLWRVSCAMRAASKPNCAARALVNAAGPWVKRVTTGARADARRARRCATSRAATSWCRASIPAATRTSCRTPTSASSSSFPTRRSFR